MPHPKAEIDERLARLAGPSIRNWEPASALNTGGMRADAYLDMGWGNLIFGQTFSSARDLVELMLEAGRERRDIALYLRDPHVTLSLAPHRLFLDPSHTFRLWRNKYRASRRRLQGAVLRRVEGERDAREANRIYASRHMVTTDPAFMLDKRAERLRTYFIAEADPEPGHTDGEVLGVVQGVDHAQVFNDPENGASLWCLAVDGQCQVPGVGRALVCQMIEHYFARGREYLDLSVMHDNASAISLYEKLGFERVPAFCIKSKNPINEKYFIPAQPQAELNPYAKVIVDEAMRRGIAVDVIDQEAGYFTLSLGGRSVTCRESLSELTTAIAMSRCDDKRVTRRLLEGAGLGTPPQADAGNAGENAVFLAEHGSVVVKPARGEQGGGISVDVRDPDAVEAAITQAREVCPDVVLEKYCEGEDVRVIVINYEVVAAAVRRAAIITGTGTHTMEQLIQKYNRRRMAATGGESRVPRDAQTARCLAQAGLNWDSVPEKNRKLQVRKAANLHTGGTIHDVTARLGATLRDACIRAARAIDIPVTGLDLLTPDVAGEEYVIIEANERPGLANHEPQPTAERFIDSLFPHSTSGR